jgi:hypothetical protein
MNKPHNVYKVILFNDIVNSTKLWAKYGNKMYREISRTQSNVNQLLKSYNGFLIKTIGDSFMIAFEDIIDSIEFVINLQKKIDTTKSEIEEKIKFRTGIYYGIVKEKKILIQKCLVKDFFGSVVNIASRLESKVSEAGDIAIGIKSNNVLNNILMFFKQKKYKFEIVEYKKKCKSNTLKSIHKKKITLKHICKDINFLKGVDKSITVLKIKKK